MRISGVVVATSLLIAATAAACGTRAGSGPDADKEPVTAAAVAAVALEYLPADTSARTSGWGQEDLPEGTVSADLRYHADSGYDGDLVRVAVVPGRVPLHCAQGAACARIGARNGSRLRLAWQLDSPEEDPGLVMVVGTRHRGRVLVTYSGPVISRDPRKLDLDIPVDCLADVAADPRIDLRTDRETLAAGEALPGWTTAP